MESYDRAAESDEITAIEADTVEPSTVETRSYNPVAPPASVASTVVVTFLFGFFGLIPAVLNSRRERDRGRPTSRYWRAFWWTIIASTVLWLALIFALVAVVAKAGGGANDTLHNAARSAKGEPAASAPVDSKLRALIARYGSSVASTARRVDPSTVAALIKNPNDASAGIAAISEVSGVSTHDIRVVSKLSATEAPALQAGQALNANTAKALITDPSNPPTLQAALKQIQSKLGESRSEAIANLQALSSIPSNELDIAIASDAAVAAAGAQLKTLLSLPTSDLQQLVALEH